MNVRASAIAAALLFLFPAAAQAGVRDEVLKAMDQCAGVADKDQRLACFDALAPQVKAAIGEVPVAQNGPPTAEQQKSWFGFDIGNIFGNGPAQQTTPDKFGADRLPAPTPKEGEPQPDAPIESISAKVSDYALNPFGKFTVFLDNGQIWKQIDGDSDLATFHKNGGNTVVISRGMIGSYDMQINGTNKVFKVKRVK